MVAQTQSLERRNGKKTEFKSFYLPLTKESIGGYVAITGEVLNIEDAYLIPPTVEYRLNRDFDQRMGYRTKSMLVVPMRDHKDEIIGVLQLINSMDEHGNVVPFRKEYESLILSLASQAAVAIQNARLIDEIRNLFRSLVRYSAKAIDARSPHTAGHSGRVARYSVRIMEAINEEKNGRFADVHFSPQEIEEMKMAGWLHDIGKIGVREAVLEKENKLTHDQSCKYRKPSLRPSADGKSLRSERERKFSDDDLLKRNKLTAETEKHIDEQLKIKLSALDDDLAFLKRINVPGFLKEEDRVRLKAIAEKPT
ncbi:MAG: GAF domain-containing protein, partial [candidate division KSB1 bacterium]|nr:GAF domain-containing protein [candidate division KSB1 bacterium]